MMRKYKLMKCLDDSCDSAAEKGNADESQVRRDQAVVCPDVLPGLKSVRQYRKLKIKQQKNGGTSNHCPGEASGGRRSELAVSGTFRRTGRLFTC